MFGYTCSEKEEDQQFPASPFEKVYEKHENALHVIYDKR